MAHEILRCAILSMFFLTGKTKRNKDCPNDACKEIVEVPACIASLKKSLVLRGKGSKRIKRRSRGISYAHVSKKFIKEDNNPRLKQIKRKYFGIFFDRILYINECQ